ncbi:DNA polymerase III subunit gamma/tau [Coralliovum pocilloporae]|uniref:DNA polymerase III subunit gamma/tau n=1 Tax=Coralliovum pocilloporae TaxID=3066369 RepID=UPI0033077A8D
MDDTSAKTPENKASGQAGYRVLARKYRPRTFDDMIGQEPLVRTLSNAFETGRIAQAYMLTGVRGVGKTTTARILARALNYEVPGEIDQPTIHMPAFGSHCEAIIEGRHVDIIEMDAASHTGIGDIREIIEATRYKPVSARYKVYIIDEVHMLSTAAFNGLLKTLEEPPEHVKFIFATTEIRKVPVTVLSRCQRFDLRRIDASDLTGHLRMICDREAVEIDDEALAMIARAGEGSARDSLSLLDQAMAHGAGRITADDIRQMLGLADRARVIDLFEAVIRGALPDALTILKDLYDVGAEPFVVLSDLSEFTHLVTRLRVIPDSASDASLSEEERTRGLALAEKLSIRVLSRAWQILLKGLPDVQAAPRPLAAAEMVLVRLAYAADLPTPDEALKALLNEGVQTDGSPAPGGGSGSGSGGGGGGAPAQARFQSVQGGRVATAPRAMPQRETIAQADAGPQLRRFEDIIALAEKHRNVVLKLDLENKVRPLRLEPGRLEIGLTPDAPKDFANKLSRQLKEWTGYNWIIAVEQDAEADTLAERRDKTKRKMLTDARSDPLVEAVLKRFPGAEIVDVRVHEDLEDPILEAVPEADDEVAVDDLGLDEFDSELD